MNVMSVILILIHCKFTLMVEKSLTWFIHNLHMYSFIFHSQDYIEP